MLDFCWLILNLSIHFLLVLIFQASWTESKPKLEKDPQGRSANPDLDPSDMEKLFREHTKMLFEVIFQLHVFNMLMNYKVSSLAAPVYSYC